MPPVSVTLRRFERLRRRALPCVGASGYLTDEDVARSVCSARFATRRVGADALSPALAALLRVSGEAAR